MNFPIARILTQTKSLPRDLHRAFPKLDDRFPSLCVREMDAEPISRRGDSDAVEWHDIGDFPALFIFAHQAAVLRYEVKVGADRRKHLPIRVLNIRGVERGVFVLAHAI